MHLAFPQSSLCCCLSSWGSGCSEELEIFPPDNLENKELCTPLYFHAYASHAFLYCRISKTLVWGPIERRTFFCMLVNFLLCFCCTFHMLCVEQTYKIVCSCSITLEKLKLHWGYNSAISALRCFCDDTNRSHIHFSFMVCGVLVSSLCINVDVLTKMYFWNFWENDFLLWISSWKV